MRPTAILKRLSATLLLLAALASQLAAQPGYQQEVRLPDKNLAVRLPTRWRVGNQSRDSVSVHVPLARQRPTSIEQADKTNPKPEFVVASEAGMLITVERRRNHAEAVRELAEIASEYPERATPLIIEGWPAIERRYRALMPQPGEQEEGFRGNVVTSFTTTAVAVADTVVRFETMLAPDADPKLSDEALSIARTMRGQPGPAEVSRRELEEVRRLTRTPRAPKPPGRTPGGGDKRAGGGKEPGVAVQVQTGNGELEVATNDGQNVVVAANSGYSFSSNFGASYTSGGGTPCNQVRCDGDPSLAVGASGNFYYAWIGGPTTTTLGDGVSRSTNNGQTFVFRGMAATCPGTTSCTVADQEHIAADRNNAAAGGGDRLYNVWRDFAPSFSLRISCSTDSGATWTSGTAIGAGDFPRVSVGRDGFVYVAWASGANMRLHKYSNCDAGLAPQAGWPITAAPFTNVVCPVAGLDRCNGRNILSSPKVAVDDLDASHVYYVFATSTGAGNEDVMVFDSTNGGATFPRSVRINNNVTGRRYMPWISSYGGVAVVSWYDRRTATVANNDLTRFYVGGAAVRGPNLVALSEIELSGNNDAQCSTWPCLPNATTDSESCSVQPQLAGRCFTTLTPMPAGSGTPCDFSSGPACPAGETCFVDRGCPKYGDYNGNAAGAGRHYSAWASARPPASIGGAAGNIRVYASADRIPSDFYVRDWSSSATVFDNGAQPSTNANFWSTSDIWNQNTSTAAAPGGGGFVVGDPPTRSGSNFVFARVSRRAAAMSTAPSAAVNVDFLYGDYGIGAAFVPIGSESVTFAAADMTKTTPGHSWSVPAGASLHLCLATQITGPDGDAFAAPSVVGTAPGPADPFILADNNKAQRNLQDTVGTSEGTELIAIVRNAEKKARPMTLRLNLPRGVRVAGVADIVGGRRANTPVAGAGYTDRAQITSDGRLPVGQLKPGEARWVRFRFTSLEGLDRPTPIDVFEDTNPPGNGFTILLHRDTFERVVRRNQLYLAAVLARLAELERNADAKQQAEIAARVAEAPSKDVYLKYLAGVLPQLGRILDTHLKRSGGADPFEIRAALQALSAAAGHGQAEAATAAQASFFERLDAHLSMLNHRR